jgi:hypothetical protein
VTITTPATGLGTPGAGPPTVARRPLNVPLIVVAELGPTPGATAPAPEQAAIMEATHSIKATDRILMSI